MEHACGIPTEPAPPRFLFGWNGTRNVDGRRLSPRPAGQAERPRADDRQQDRDDQQGDSGQGRAEADVQEESAFRGREVFDGKIFPPRGPELHPAQRPAGQAKRQHRKRGGEHTEHDGGDHNGNSEPETDSPAKRFHLSFSADSGGKLDRKHPSIDGKSSTDYTDGKRISRICSFLKNIICEKCFYQYHPSVKSVFSPYHERSRS